MYSKKWSRNLVPIPYNEEEIDKELERLDLEGSLCQFVQWSFKKKTGKDFILNWHHIKICEYLEAVFRHDINRLIINIAPRYSKTEIAVKGFIEWCLAKVPDSRFIHLSYSDMLALDNSSQIREDIKSDWYQYHWAMTTKQDSDAKQKWYTTQGGGLYATGTAGSITGFGAGRTGDGFGGCVIIDDPQKPSEGYSDDIRKKTNDRLNNTIISRLNNPKKTPIIIIMQRIHELDMTGFCLNGGTGDTWEHLSIPALNDNDEPLWSLKHDYAQLSQMKQADPQTFSGQYMQSPAPAEGALFKRAWFKTYRELPARLESIVMGWDFAIKEKDTADYTVGIVVARKGAEWFVLDLVRDKMSFPTACKAVINLSLKWPQAHKKIVEDKANGSAVVDTLKKQVPGLVLTTPTRDKVFRAQSILPNIEAGNLYLPEKAVWLHDFINELCSFPYSAHDDCVDALVYCCMELSKAGILHMPIAGHSNLIHQ